MELLDAPDKDGFYGNFGGAFVPEVLKAEFEKITATFLKYKDDVEFNTELNDLYTHYVGRPSPVYFAKNLSRKHGTDIYLKREDLNHTGAHKINHCLGEALLAKRMGKKKIIAETGAGQHGVKVAGSVPCAVGGADLRRIRLDVGLAQLAAQVAGDHAPVGPAFVHDILFAPAQHAADEDEGILVLVAHW